VLGLAWANLQARDARLARESAAKPGK